MKKVNKEAIKIARLINEFLADYAPTHITQSANTLHSYQITLSLYLLFLEEIISVTPESFCAKHFERKHIEKWIQWLSDKRGCSPATCNIRLGALRTFLRFAGSRNIEYLYLYEEATEIPLKKTPKKKVEGMSKAAVKALFSVPDTSTLTGICYVQDKSYQNVQDKITNSGNSFTLSSTSNVTTIFMRNLVKGGSQWTVRDLCYCSL